MEEGENIKDDIVLSLNDDGNIQKLCETDPNFNLENGKFSIVCTNWEDIKICPTAKYLILTDDSKPVCPISTCGKSLTRRYSLNVHIRNHLITEGLSRNIFTKEQKPEFKISYYCSEPICHYSIVSSKDHFTKFKYLKQHYMKVHAPKTFICSHCKKAFPTDSVLQTHLKICGIKFECNNCKASYNTLEALQTHVKRKSHTFDAKKYKFTTRSKTKEKAIKIVKDLPISISPSTTESRRSSINSITQQQLPELIPRPQHCQVIRISPTLQVEIIELNIPKRSTVEFGTQTVTQPIRSKATQHCQTDNHLNLSHHQTTTLGKRKITTETQTGQVRVSQDTQTAKIVKRVKRANKKKPPVAEAETQCINEPIIDRTPQLPIINKPEQTSIIRPLNYQDNFTSITDNGNDNDNICSPNENELVDANNGRDKCLNGLASSFTNTDSDVTNLWSSIEENRETQTDPLLLGSSSINQVGLLLDFVTSGTQTFPYSPPDLNAGNNMDENDELDFPFFSAEPEEPEDILNESLESSLNDVKQSHSSFYLETMDNETQTQSYEFNQNFLDLFENSNNFDLNSFNLMK